MDFLRGRWMGSWRIRGGIGKKISGREMELAAGGREVSAVKSEIYNP